MGQFSPLAAIEGPLWIGIDAGKTSHHLAVVDALGEVVLSRRITNDQAAIEEAIAAVTATGARLSWAVDLASAASALLLALLTAAGQKVVYVPGRTVNRMAGAFSGEAKTDAKDAVTIANTARMRRDFLPAEPKPELVAELALLTGHRADINADRVRSVSRLRELLAGIFPALEREFDFSTRAALVLVERYQTPKAIRRSGASRIAAYLAKQDVRRAADTAERAAAAARSQTMSLPGQNTAAELIGRIAADLLRLRERLKELDARIKEAFSRRPQAEVILSMPGMGPQLGAEFAVAVGDLSTFRDAGHLASYAGLAPVPRDSGRISGNLHRPKRYNRRLRRVFYMSALSSLKTSGPNRDYYARKRSEGKRHRGALMALARRRVDVLWALLRDDRAFTPSAPAVQAA
ncbi:IS110 family RNA-guided transposase [Nocardiopsis suaedae]|uniref:IS110 family transposase n=1 Tax=Nocardiopsis suaedae TaxID=3018444 RepID=A0ABT4TIY5_9ACTN|nr:IS110 family transposase [Nocardiopsis suaedae]MDA2804229.1 IS110 family transposase [Nocardiopsis suaedae]